MSDKLKAAFLVVAPEADKLNDKSTIKSNVLELVTVIVPNYREAEKAAIQLVEDGVNVIELCAGFGNKGVNLISEAISYKVPVGVVRFDNHPGLNNLSGDQMFD